MTKQELLENFTMEQLADMVVKLNIASEMSAKHIHNLEREIVKKQDEINRIKTKVLHKETVINQIDDILDELFGVTHDIVSKPDEFKEILKEKIKNSKTIADFLPAEPIKVADMLISAEGEYERNAIGKAFYGNDKGTYNLFDTSELRQIAEHLLVYCNANGDGEKDE